MKNKFKYPISIGLITFASSVLVFPISCSAADKSMLDVNINGNTFKDTNSLIDYLKANSETEIIEEDIEATFSLKIGGKEKHFASMAEVIRELNNYITLEEVYIDENAQISAITSEITNTNNNILKKNEPIFKAFKKADGDYTFAPIDNESQLEDARNDALKSYMHVHNAYYFDGIYFSNKSDVYAYVMANAVEKEGDFELGYSKEMTYTLLQKNGSEQIIHVTDEGKDDPNFIANVNRYVTNNAVPYYGIDGTPELVDENNIYDLSNEFEADTSKYIDFESNDDQVTQVVDVSNENIEGDLYGPYFVKSGSGVDNITNSNAWKYETVNSTNSEFIDDAIVNAFTEHIASILLNTVLEKNSTISNGFSDTPNDITLLNIFDNFTFHNGKNFSQLLSEITIDERESLSDKYYRMILNIESGKRNTLFNTIALSYSWLIDTMITHKINSSKIMDVVTHFVQLQERFDAVAIQLVSPLLVGFDFESKDFEKLKIYTNSWQFEKMNFQRDFKSYTRWFYGKADAGTNRFMFNLIKFIVKTNELNVQNLVQNINNIKKYQDQLKNFNLVKLIPEFFDVNYYYQTTNRSFVYSGKTYYLDNLSPNDEKVLSDVVAQKLFQKHFHALEIFNSQSSSTVQKGIWGTLNYENFTNLEVGGLSVSEVKANAELWAEMENKKVISYNEKYKSLHDECSSFENAKSEFGLKSSNVVEHFYNWYNEDAEAVDAEDPMDIASFEQNRKFVEYLFDAKVVSNKFADVSNEQKGFVTSLVNVAGGIKDLIKKDNEKELILSMNYSQLSLSETVIGNFGMINRTVDANNWNMSILQSNKPTALSGLAKGFSTAFKVVAILNTVWNMAKTFSTTTYRVMSYTLDTGEKFYWDGAYSKTSWWGFGPTKTVGIDSLKLIGVQTIISGYSQTGIYSGTERYTSIELAVDGQVREFIRKTHREKEFTFSNNIINEGVIWELELFDHSAKRFVVFRDESPIKLIEKVMASIDVTSKEMYKVQGEWLTTNQQVIIADAVDRLVSSLKPVYILQKPTMYGDYIHYNPTFTYPTPFYNAGVVIENDPSGNAYEVINPNINLEAKNAENEELIKFYVDNIIGKNDSQIAKLLVDQELKGKYVLETKEVLFNEILKNPFVEKDNKFDSLRIKPHLSTVKTFIDSNGRKRYFMDKEEVFKEMTSSENFNLIVYNKGPKRTIYKFDNQIFNSYDEMLTYVLETYSTKGDEHEN